MKKTRLVKIALVVIVMALTLSCLFACGEKKVTITLMDGDTALSTIEVELGSTPTINDPNNKTGYTFVGWYTDKDLSQPFVEGSEINDHMTLYAKFVRSDRYISVDANGGSAVEKVKIGEDGSYTIATPTRAGYTFVNYTYYDETDDTTKELPLSGTYSLSGSIRVRANWTINSYTVTFMNGSDKVKDAEAEYQKTVSLPVVSKTGYTFTGWYTEADEAFTDETKVTANITVSARFVAKSFNISFDVQGGSAVENLPVEYDSAYTLDAPVKSGYTFTGWTYNGAPFAATGTYSVDSNIHLVATWAINTYTVTLKDYDGTTIATQENVAHGASFAPYAGVQAGYEVVGYYIDKNDEGTKISDVNAYQVVANTTIFVKISPCTYHIEVIGCPSESTDVVYNTQYSLSATPVREGYTFAGYTLNNEAFAPSGTYTWTTDISVVANFEKDPMYNKVTVSLVSIIDGQQKTIAAKIIDKRATVDLGDVNTLTDGYDFVGWYYGDNQESVAYNAADAFDDDDTLYAIYSRHLYTVTVSKDGGEGDSSVTVAYKDTYTLPVLTKRGYTFTGYTRNGSSIASTGTYTWTENITVAATWSRDTVTVTFMNEGNAYAVVTPIYKYSALTAENLPATSPDKAGYTFSHWSVAVDGAAYDVTSEVEADLILYSVFTPNTYTITVWMCVDTVASHVHTDDCGKQEYSVVYGGEVTLDENPIKSGYGFVRYLYQGNTFNRVVTSYEYAYDIELVIEWTRDNSLFVDKGTYFLERGSIEDPYTYVFLTNVEYNFGTTRITPSAGAPISMINDFKFSTAKTLGAFTFTFEDQYGSTGTRNACVVNYIYDMSAGADLSSAYAASKNSNVHQVTLNSNDEYVMDAGVVNYIPDVLIKNDNTTQIDMEAANIIVSVKDGDVNVDSSLYAVSGDVITFNDSLIGKTLSVTLHPKYALSGDSINDVCYKVRLNDGVNVYTDAELRAQYRNINTHKINILRNIVVDLPDSDYIAGHGKEFGYITLSSGATLYVDMGAPINDYNHGAYVRITNDRDDSLAINGNYFEIDGSKLPYIDNRYDQYGAGGSKFTDGNAYRISNTQIGVFLYSCGERDSNGSLVRYYANNEGKGLSMNNMRVTGNNRMEYAGEGWDLGDGGLPLLKMSSAYIGLVIRGGLVDLNNVTVTDCIMMSMLDGGVSGHSTYEMDNYSYSEEIEARTQRQATQMKMANCIVDRSWANGIYIYDLCKLIAHNTKIGASNGAAIHIDDKPYPRKATHLSTEVTLDLYSSANINNWISGEEAWFVAYGQSQTALAMKQLIYSAVSSSGLTNLRTIDGASKMNFAIFIRSAGSYSTAAWSTGNGDVNNADLQEKPSAIFTTHDASGLKILYDSSFDAPASIAAGQLYVNNVVDSETPNNVMEIYIPVYSISA